jgi:hypothetical protein
VAVGIDAEVLSHHENWRQFPVVTMPARFTPAARAESTASVADELLDLDDGTCPHLTTAIIALPDRSRQQVPCSDDWPGRVQRPSK